jgi:hypothetical protein
MIPRVSAYWIAQKALKLHFDAEDRLAKPPHGYSTQVIWETAKEFFNVQTRYRTCKHSLLPVFVRIFFSFFLFSLSFFLFLLASLSLLFCCLIIISNYSQYLFHKIISLLIMITNIYLF